ncbi:MAG: protein kinase [Nannocystaceae bacterium]|nr:protein kinase [Nannocystaceae bacterium]
MADDDSELAPGELIDGKYLLVRRVGSGGMGVVHAAKRTALGDVVAIKSLLRSQNTAVNRARFLREAQASARIRHPNVVQVFDFAVARERVPYLVMEYLEGLTLAQVLAERGRLPLPRALALFSSICAAVEAGHRRGVVHRDLKPGNVMLARSDDGREQIKVLDFGLARLLGPAAGELTSPGALLGTVAYMAPEQIADAAATTASDVFALGVLLYELVTGRLPFRAETHVGTIMKITAGEYDDPEPLCEGASIELLAAIRAALSHDPDARPGSAEALAQAAGAPVASRWEEPAAPATRPVAEASDEELDQRTVARTSDGDAPRLHVTTAAAAAPRIPAPRLADAPLVGRAQSLTRLEALLAETESGSARLAVVLGEHGVGKTRLLDEVCRRAASQGAVVLRGQFFDYEGDRPPPYETFAWMLANTAVDGDLSRADAELRRDAAREPQDKWQRFASLAQQIGARALPPQARGSQAEPRRLIVRLEDMDRATAAELDFVAYLAHALGQTALVVLGSATPGNPEFERWLQTLAAKRSVTQIALAPWSIDEVRQWLDAALPGINVRPQDLRRIAHASGGMPHGTVELVRHLLAQGAIRRSDRGYVCELAGELELPEGVQSLLEAQLSRLDEPVRAVLEVACVIGEHFRFETLCLAADLDEGAAEPLLDAAQRARVLSDRAVAPGSDYRFTNPGLRRLLYERLTTRRRRKLHARVVEALQSLYPERDRIAHVLAYHLHAMQTWAPLLTAAISAAEQALRVYDVDLADACVRWAQDAASGLAAEGAEIDPRAAARLDRCAGVLANAHGEGARAEPLLRRAIESAHAVEEPSLALDGLLGLCECQLGRGALRAASETAAAAIALAQRLGDRRREGAAKVQLASCLGPLGRYDEARAAVEPVANDAALPPVLHALASRELAWIEAKTGNFAAAERAALRAQAAARAARDAHAEYRAVSALSLVYAECGDVEAALPQLELALRLARTLSLRRREGIELANAAECRMLLGDRERALADATRALEIFVEIGDAASEGDCRVNVGRLLLALGRRSEAIAMLDAARAACAASGRTEYEGIALCELGDARMGEGAVPQARALFERARECFERIGSALSWRADLGLARAQTVIGEEQPAREAAARALAEVERQLAALPSRAAGDVLLRARAELELLLVPPTHSDPGDAVGLQARLTAQHDELQRLAAAMLAEGDVSHVAAGPQDAARSLSRFAQRLRRHAELEAQSLYPALLEHADAHVREVATRLYGDGVGLYDEFFAFAQRWAEPETIAAAPERFAGELVAVLRSLGRRMRREDVELHPLAAGL